MSVTIDQTGRDDFAGGTDSLSDDVSTFDLSPWTDGDDPSSGNSNSTILDDAARLVHRNDRAT